MNRTQKTTRLLPLLLPLLLALALLLWAAPVSAAEAHAPGFCGRQ